MINMKLSVKLCTHYVRCMILLVLRTLSTLGSYCRFNGKHPHYFTVSLGQCSPPPPASQVPGRCPPPPSFSTKSAATAKPAPMHGPAYEKLFTELSILMSRLPRTNRTISFVVFTWNSWKTFSLERASHIYSSCSQLCSHPNRMLETTEKWTKT
jgi:hypothetical protein